MRKMMLLCSTMTVATLTISSVSGTIHAAHEDSTAWSMAESVAEVNSPASDGCPIESRDGLSLYIASMRPGGGLGNDIWAADRSSKDAPFGGPVNLGAPVNTDANDFCPTPIYGSYLLFVSERPGPETCNAGPGRGDIYIVRRNAVIGWGAPRHLGCAETGTGPNTSGAEFSPSLAAQIMRHILVDIARARGRDKRGGGKLQVSLSDAADLPIVRSAELVALDDALKSLEAFDARKSRVIEMRFFGGLKHQEIADILLVSVATVRRDWSLARAWLHRELRR